MKQWTWNQNAPQHCYACCVGSLGEGNQTPESFGRSYGTLSPLYWRIPICVWVTVTLTWSVVFFWGPPEKYLLYMTHWGLLLILLESLFGIIVAIKTSDKEILDTSPSLPWYVKTYWVLYNITIPVAFLVTLFYWCVLKSRATGRVNYAPNPVLDVMLHGINTLVMLVELVCSGHPSRLLHIMQPLYFALAYCIFSVVYYVAGGLDPWGNPFIYPVIDWSKPEQTLVVITLTALFLALMHLVTVAIASARDLLIKRCLPEKSGHYNDGFTA